MRLPTCRAKLRTVNAEALRCCLLGPMQGMGQQEEKRCRSPQLLVVLAQVPLVDLRLQVLIIHRIVPPELLQQGLQRDGHVLTDQCH